MWKEILIFTGGVITGAVIADALSEDDGPWIPCSDTLDFSEDDE